jgi:hypothetical protein
MLLGVVGADVFAAALPRTKAAGVAVLLLAAAVCLIPALGYLADLSGRFVHFILFVKTAPYGVLIGLVLYEFYL